MDNLKLFVELRARSNKFTKPFKNALAISQKFDKSIKSNRISLTKLNKSQKQLDRFKSLVSGTRETAKAFREAQEKAQKLSRELSKAEKPTKRFTKQVKRAQEQAHKLKQRLRSERDELAQLRRNLDSAGHAGKRLADRQNSIDRATRSTNQSLRTQAKRLRKISTLQSNLRKTSAFAARTAVFSAGAVFTGRTILDKMASPMQKALNFESSMADVKKVTNFSPEGFKVFEKQLDRLSHKIPLTVGQIAQITASGGQLGIQENQLLGFTTLVSKMSTAYDMMPDAAGDATAKLMNVYKLTIDETKSLGDAVNYLSDNSAAKARDMIQSLGRVGGVAKQFGLTGIQTAALTNAFIALGKRPEVASTAINSLLQRLQTAPKQSKKFQLALADMGIASTDLAENIKNNPQKALTGFLEALGKVDKTTRAGLTVDLFGTEYSDDVSLLVGNLEIYQKALSLTAKKENYLGSIQKEFDVRAATRANKLVLLKNRFNSLQMAMGDLLLDTLIPFVEKAKGWIKTAQRWIEQNPRLAKTLGKVAIGVTSLMVVMGSLGMVLASIIGPLALLRYGFGMLAVSGGVIAWVKKLGGVFKWLGTRAIPLAFTALRGIAAFLIANPIGLAVATLAVGAYLIYKNWNSLVSWWNSWTLRDVGTNVGEFLFGIVYKLQSKWQGFINWWNNISLTQLVVDVHMDALKWAMDKGKAFVKWWNGISLKSLVPDIKMPSMPKFGKKWQDLKMGWNRGKNRAEASQRMTDKKYYNLSGGMQKLSAAAMVASLATPVHADMLKKVELNSKQVDTRAGLSVKRSAPAKQVTVNNNQKFVIQAMPGMNENQLAEKVAEKVRQSNHGGDDADLFDDTDY